MTKSELMRRAALSDSLHRLGFDADEVDTLRRISNTLHRWHDLECGTDAGVIERDDKTGRPFFVSEWGGRWGMTSRTRRPIADRETGALRRLSALMEKHAPLSAYVQTDPRGRALYILRPGDIPDGFKAESCYSRGVCVY